MLFDRSLATLETFGSERWRAPPGSGSIEAGKSPAGLASAGELLNTEECEGSPLRRNERSVILGSTVSRVEKSRSVDIR